MSSCIFLRIFYLTEYVVHVLVLLKVGLVLRCMCTCGASWVLAGFDARVVPVASG